jgi:DGQHR domain-containing protein
MILKKTAVRVNQGDLTIYATSLLVKDLMISNFYQVDKLDSSNTGSGFQRVLDKTRTKRLADYILDAWKDKDAFLPTSIFLATDKDVFFDNEKNEITFEIEKVCPFNVVDGQHRVEGLIEAARQNPEIGNFELVANIAVNLDDVSQMCHFLIVNTTQKSVDRAVEQQIISRLTGMVDIEDIPTLPKWIQRQVMKGEDKEALVITNYLNTELDSPWYQKIRMANEGKEDNNTINQKSFVQSIKGYILSSNNPLAAESDIDRRNKILKNYWKAIGDLLVKKDSNVQTVVFKTIGLELFNIISATVFMKLYNEKNFTVDRIKSMLQHGFSNLPNEHLAVQNPEWWESGGGASNINKAAVRHIATELNKAMNIQKIDDNIQL